MVHGIFPMQWQEEMGFIGYFVKLAAASLEKTVSHVLIQKSA